MPTTPNRAYPYPGTGTAPNVPFDIQNLAEELDVDVKGIADALAALTAGTSAVVPLTTSYANQGAGLTVSRQGTLVCLSGRVYRKAGFSGTQIGTIPTGYRPEAPAHDDISTRNGVTGGAGPLLQIYVDTTGVMNLTHVSNGVGWDEDDWIPLNMTWKVA